MTNLFVHVYPDDSLRVSLYETFTLNSENRFAFPSGEHVVVVTDERGGFTEENAVAVIVHALVQRLRDGRSPPKNIEIEGQK